MLKAFEGMQEIITVSAIVTLNYILNVVVHVL